MPESVSLVQERQYRMRAIELVLLELILSVTLFLLTLGQEVCDFGDGSEYRAEDPGFYVHPNLSCTDTGLSFNLVHNYEQTRNTRVQLYYDCTNLNGRKVLVGQEVPNSINFQLDNFLYTVSLAAIATDISSCQVYGCYQENILDQLHFYYPIQSKTCQYGNADVTTTQQELATTAANSDVPTVMTTQLLSTEQQKTTNRTPSGEETNNAGATISTVFLSIAGVLLTVLL